MNRRILVIIAVLVIILGGAALLMLPKSSGSGGKPAAPFAGAQATAFAQAQDLEAKNDLLNARAAYQKMVADFPSSSDITGWQKKVDELNIKLLFSPVITPKSTQYTVKPGDTLTKIAREYKTTVELIAKSNNLVQDRIVPGKKLKVSTAVFNIFVDKSQNILVLKSDEDIIKTYIVSTGANNSTPVGTFKIVNKLPNPTWFKAGAVVASDSPENVLGTRWMGFDLAGYGIHGTVEPQNLGKQVTQGCVRMLNAEVEELYTIVPTGTLVTIVD